MTLLLILLLCFDAELSFFQNLLIALLIVFFSHLALCYDARFRAVCNVLRINLSILQVLGEHFLLNLVLCLSDCLIDNCCHSEALIGISFSEVIFKVTDHGLGALLIYNNSTYFVKNLTLSVTQFTTYLFIFT